MNEDDLKEFERIQRVSDQLCTTHSFLRDMYYKRAFFLSILIFVASTILVATVFIDPAITESLANITNFHLNTREVLGLLSVFVFILSIFELKTNWSGKAYGHEISVNYYSLITQDCRDLNSKLDTDKFHDLKKRYVLGQSFCSQIPEKYFLKAKKYHKVKVALSKSLDNNPGANIFLLRVSMTLKDTFSSMFQSEKDNS